MGTFRSSAVATVLVLFALPLHAVTAPGASVDRGLMRAGSPGSPAIDVFAAASLGEALDRVSPAAAVASRWSYDAGTTRGWSLVTAGTQLRRQGGFTPIVVQVPVSKMASTTTPEPGTLVLMGTGLLVLLAYARSRGYA